MRKRSQPPSSPVRWMAIISLLVAVATACGDDGETSGGSAGSTEGGSTEEESGDPGDGELRPLTIGYPGPFSSFLHTQVADVAGLFEDHGFDVSLETMQAPTIPAALESGEIDATMIVGTSLVAGLGGLPVRVVGVSLNSFDYVIVADEEIEDIDDLAGAKVASFPLVSTPGAALLSALDDAGLSTDEVEVVVTSDPLAPPRLLEAGDVDAALLDIDSALRLAETNPDLHTIYTPDEFVENPYVGVVVSEQRIEEDPDMVAAILESYLAASSFIVDNSDETIEIISESYDMSPEMAAELYEIIVPAVVMDGQATDAMLEGQTQLSSLVLEREVTRDELDAVFDLSILDGL